MPRRTRPDPVCQMLGARVRELRQERGLSLNQLTVACGESQGHLSNIENGLVNVTVGTLVKIANGLGTTPGVVMCTGNSELEKFVEEFRALPAKVQRRCFTSVSRALGAGLDGASFGPAPVSAVQPTPEPEG